MTTKWMTLGTECRRFREDQGATLADYARKTGLSRQAISMFELGYNSSMQMLCFYIKEGMDIDVIIKAYELDMRRV